MVNFKVKGLVTLVRKDIDGSVTGTITKENVFTDYGYRSLMTLARTIDFSGQANQTTAIHLSPQNRNPTADNHTVTNCLPTNYPIGVTPEKWFDPTDDEPMHAQYIARSNYTGSPKTFQTVGLRYTYSYASTIDAIAYVLLDEPVVQGEYETIDIYYKLFFIEGESKTFARNNSISLVFAKYFSGFGGAIDFNSPQIASIVDARGIENTHRSVIAPYRSNSPNYSNRKNFIALGTSEARNAGNLEYKVYGTSSLTGFTGRVITSLSTGYVSHSSTESLNYHNLIDIETFNPVQTIWGKRSGFTNYLYDLNQTATGGGKLHCEVDTQWQRKYPGIYRIDITRSGSVGEAQYNLKFMPFVHFNSDTTKFVSEKLLHLGRGQDLYYEGMKMFPDDDANWDEWLHRNVVKYDETSQLIYYCKTGLTICDTLSTQHKNYYAHTFPNTASATIKATNITQVCVRNGIIYVACKDTGLWKIRPDLYGQSGSVENLYPFACMGVTLSLYNGSLTLYIAALDGIRYELNSFSRSLVTEFLEDREEARWSNISAIEGNPYSPNNDGEIAIVVPYSDSSKYCGFYWWSHTTGGIVKGKFATNIVDTRPGIIQPSSNGKDWVSAHNHDYRYSLSSTHRFGSDEYVHSNLYYYETLNNSFATVGTFISDRQYFSGSSREGVYHYDCIDNTITPDTGVDMLFYRSSSAGSILYSRVLHFNQSNIVYMGGLINVPRSFDLKQYGAIAGGWITDADYSKVTHSEFEPLIDGLKLKFDNNGSTNTFVEGESYIIPVCRGILGDNATKITHASYFYGKDLNMRVPFPNGATVATTSPYLYRVPEAGTSSNFDLVGAEYTAMKVFLNGVLIPTEHISLSSVPPDEPGLMTFNSLLGEFYFHSSDVGKSITGYYSYTSTT